MNGLRANRWSESLPSLEGPVDTACGATPSGDGVEGGVDGFEGGSANGPGLDSARWKPGPRLPVERLYGLGRCDANSAACARPGTIEAAAAEAAAARGAAGASWRLPERSGLGAESTPGDDQEQVRIWRSVDEGALEDGFHEGLDEDGMFIGVPDVSLISTRRTLPHRYFGFSNKSGRSRMKSSGYSRCPRPLCDEHFGFSLAAFARTNACKGGRSLFLRLISPIDVSAACLHCRFKRQWRRSLLGGE
ncbi:MAG: hypothetical protein JWQ11_3882 [Rhizobacter sp.]|nr:hypothetical protein [Rhizobacter sp.]